MTLGQGIKQLFSAGIQSLTEAVRPKPTAALTDGEDLHSTVPNGAGRRLALAVIDGVQAISQAVARSTGIRLRTAQTNEAPAPAGDSPIGTAVDFKTALSFRGETIERDISPAVHLVKQGQTLERVALKHLGVGAMQEHLERHVREIARLHGLEPGEMLSEGRVLILPGHTSDGGTILQTADGTRYTRWSDGVQRVERCNHSAYVRRPFTGGGFSEHHWGPKPQDNYELTRNAQGEYRVDGRIADTSDRRVAMAMLDNPADTDKLIDAVAAVARLLDFLEERLRSFASEHETEIQHLQQTRKHLQGLEARGRRDGLHPHELEHTYRELEKLLGSTTQAATDHAGLFRLAREVSFNAANPTGIVQSAEDFGSAAALEARTYMIYPSDAVRLVVEVALTGSFTGAGSAPAHVVTREELYEDLAAQNQQSVASRIFQSTVARISEGVAVEGRLTAVSNTLTGRNEHDVMLDACSPVACSSAESQIAMQNSLARAAADGTLPVFVEANIAAGVFGTARPGARRHAIVIVDFDPATNKVSVYVPREMGDESSGECTVSTRDLFLNTVREDSATVMPV